VDTGQAGWGVGITLGGAATDYISVPDNAALDWHINQTFEAVIKPTSLATAGEIIGKGNTDATHTGYSFFANTDGSLVLTNSFWGGTYGTTGAGAIVANTEYLVAFTRAGTVGTMYVNGAAVGAPTTFSAQAFTASGQPLTIGAQSANGVINLPFTGLVDEVAVYNTTLSAARLAAHYAARGTAGGGSGQPVKSPPGAFVAAIAHERNAERKDSHAARRLRLDYLHKRGH
jgi:hypothetical protein